MSTPYLWVQHSGVPLYEGTMHLPDSKSIVNRLLIMESLSGGRVQAIHASRADDVLLLQELLASRRSAHWLGHAGTAMRFGLAWACITPGERILRGTHRLHRRPLAPLIDALRKLGAQIECYEEEGYAPVVVTGRPLRGGTVQVDGSMSSQFITALMLIGPVLPDGLHIVRTGARVSEPYIAMTAALMEAAGARVRLESDSIYIAAQPYTPAVIRAEADWSAASYAYVALLAGAAERIHLPGLHTSSLQGDAVAATLFEAYGVETHTTAHGVTICRKAHPTRPEHPVHIDCTPCPDLAPALAAGAAAIVMPVTLTGLSTLRVKETDRIAALCMELAALGVPAQSGTDWLQVGGMVAVRHPIIHTWSDHRMAMAFAPLAPLCGGLAIEAPAVAAKSWPGFWQELVACGYTLSEMQATGL